MGTPLEKIEALQKRNQDLLGDMKKLERDYAKSKKRAETLQKEKDASRNELSRTIGVKDKLEKMAREFTKDNKKLRVGYVGSNIRLVSNWDNAGRSEACRRVRKAQSREHER